MAQKKKPAEKKKTKAKPKKEEASGAKREHKTEVKEEIKKTEEKAEKKAEEKPKKKEEKADIVAENVYTIPLRQVYRTQPKYKRTNKAVALLVKYIARHMKTGDVKLENNLNQHIWASGDCKPPRKVQVKAVKDSKGKVTVSLLK